MSVRLVLVNLGIAAAYFVLGRLGLLLALPPGYATAVWPPAGLACGACLIWMGRRVWPGIFIGSTITNSFITGHFTLGILPVVIALGSTLQAVIAEKLLRRIDPGLGFDSSGRVARFSGTVALASLIAATVGNAGLLAVGAIAPGQFAQSFATWWAGDALGMQIFTPLTLLLMDRREVWSGRRILVGMPLLLAFLLCGLVYGYVRKQEEEQLRGQFEDEADRALQPLLGIGELQIQDLGSLVTFFRASNEVLPQEFSLFAARMIQARRGFRVLEWAPLVNPGGEGDYEQLTTHLLGRSLRIVALREGDRAPAQPRVPVTYVEPLAGNESVLGLDLNSEASRHEVIERAMRSDGAVVSSRIILTQDPEGPGGVLVVQALRDGAGHVTGFCLGILDLRQVIASLGRDPALRWRLVDLSTPATPLAVNGSFPGVPDTVSPVTLVREGLYYRSVLPIADRHWELTLYKPLASFVEPHFSSSLLILFFAFATCGALGNVALTTSGERRRIAEEVHQKTRALSAQVEQRQQLERDLRESEQRYRRALDVAQLGSWSFDPAARRIHLDHWSRLHYGVAEDSIDVERFMAILHPGDREAVAIRIRAYMEPACDNAAVERFEIRIVDAEKHTRVLEITARPELERMGNRLRTRAVSGTTRDVTDRKQYEEMQRIAREAAESAMRTRAEFVANMSHELRTPMNGILGMVALALGTDLSPQQRDYLLLVQESAQSLLRLLNDILDFSKMDAGKLELESTDFDVRERFGSTLQRLAEAAHGKGLGLHLQVAPEVPRFLRGDPQRLMQIVINLVSNATKFTAHGEVAVSVGAKAIQEGRVELQVSVRDTGIGIAPAAQQRVFEPFAQADTSITRRFGGTGLGLSICRQIVALFQGRMWLESEPGRGSTFHFTARLDEVSGFVADTRPDSGTDEEKVLDGHGAPPLPPRSSPRRILVAEDYPVNQKIVIALLESRGHHITLAENGRQAVDLFQQRDFDLILMDVQMTEMDGLAATRRIRELEAGTGRHIRIVAVTASAHVGERERVLAAGMDDYLAKPYSLPGLVAAVEPAPASSGPTAVVTGTAPREEEASSPDRCFDNAAALERCLNNPSLLAKLVATFLSTQEEIRRELRGAIERDDRDGIEHWAHRLKGGVATLSAAASADAAAALESAARTADRAAIAALMARIEGEIDRLTARLAAL